MLLWPSSAPASALLLVVQFLLLVVVNGLQRGPIVGSFATRAHPPAAARAQQLLLFRGGFCSRTHDQQQLAAPISSSNNAFGTPPRGTTTRTSCTLLMRSRSNDIENETNSHSSNPSPERAAVFSLGMAASGAALGPFLDSFHSAFGVLQYDVPITATLWGPDAQHPALITAWWVPELFGLAGLIIGWLYILLDEWGRTSSTSSNSSSKTDYAVVLSPSPPKIWLGISFFTFQYWLSGVLFSAGVDRTTILMVMSTAAAGGFWFLDRTWAGLLVSTATALGGPLIEVLLLTLSSSRDADMFLGGAGYHYTDLGETGFFPLWIVPVYFLGGPANGNLARGLWTWLGAVMDSRRPNTAAGTVDQSRPGCAVCSDTRRVPCPNCDSLGLYEAKGGRTVQCNACRGRGLVICRACFSHYKEDANDIDAIRELMARMPD